jgi:3-oxoadipate enol-lactonase
MPIIDTGEARLNARWDGPTDGPVLVLSNSLGATLDMWQPQVTPFGAAFRLLRYDTRGRVVGTGRAVHHRAARH